MKTVLKKAGRLILLGIVLIAFSGFWFKKKNDLELDNILQYETQRKARRTAAKPETPKNAAPAAPAETLKPSVSEDQPSEKFESIPELDFLKLPQEFETVKMFQPEGGSASLEEVLPAAEYFWRAKRSDIWLLAGKNNLDPGSLWEISREEFLGDIRKTAVQFDAYYSRRNQSRSTWQIIEKGTVIRLEVRTKYVKEGRWFTELRLFFFFRPQYRINLVLFGSDQEMARLEETFQDMIGNFQDQLQKKYPKGLSFVPSPAAAA